MYSLSNDADPVERFGVLSRFRAEFHASLTARADALFELGEALVCEPGPVRSLVELSLAPEHRRGHGALYGAVNHGRIDVDRLRRALVHAPVPRCDGRVVLAVDVSAWLRPSADTSPERSFCHTGRHADRRALPGWSYSFVAALETGATSWCRLLDVVRLPPGVDLIAATAVQLREVITRLRAAGHHRPGDADILVVADAGYDVCRLALLLADLPVELVARLRANRVLHAPAPPRSKTRGRPPRHGAAVKLADPATWPAPATVTTTPTRRYGTATAAAWPRMHPRLVRRTAWADHDGPLPIIEGTLIRLTVQRLPGTTAPTPVWLWSSRARATSGDVDRWWRSFLRRFDLEHTFRLFKQTLGWTAPHPRAPAAADRWTWLVLAAHTQLWLARSLTTDLRRPWERATPGERLSPARVRRGYRYLRARLPVLARAPKISRPGPGRPPGRPNKHPTPHHPPIKSRKTDTRQSHEHKQAG